jgi:pyridinium-3,5-bisthiocarboxylic acid mononucleotide nickel chelatase
MHVAYIHCDEGLTGPMLLSALLGAGASLATVQAGWQQCKLPEPRVALQTVACLDTVATHLTFEAPAMAAWLAQQTYTDLVALLQGSAVAPRVIHRVLQVLQRFVEATARVHSVEDARVLALRSAPMAEILYCASGVALALEHLAIDQVIAAPLPLGFGPAGQEPGHDRLPHPLTLALCTAVPVYGARLPGALTTISGAAVLTALASSFEPLPQMTIQTVAYGMHQPDATMAIPRVQVVLGTTDVPAAAERIAVIEANIDDMNPEFYESVFEHLFAHGALDVTLTPLFMKKNRPANKLTVLAPLPAVTRLSRLMLQETSTFGVRIYEVWRQKLERFHRPVETCYGVIPVKCGVLDGRMVQAAPEYDACKRAAHERGVPVRLVYTEAVRLAASWLTETTGAIHATATTQPES